MALPKFYPFKTRYLFASSTSSADAVMSVTVPARAKYISCWFATTPMQTLAQASNQVWPAVNGTAVAGSTANVVTTSTGNSAFKLNDPSVNTYLVAGDVLSVVCSSSVGGTATFVIQEF